MAKNTRNKQKIGNAHSAYAIMCIITSALIFLSLFGLFGNFGNIFNNFFFGVFGQSVYAICCALLLCGTFLVFDKKITMDRKLLRYLILLFVATVIILNCATTAEFVTKNNPGKYLQDVYANGVKTAGGALSGIVLCLPMAYFGYAVSLIIFIALLGLTSILTYRALEKNGARGVNKSKKIEREFKPVEQAKDAVADGEMYIHQRGEEKRSLFKKSKKVNRNYINEPDSEELREILSDSELMKGVEKYEGGKSGEKRPVPASVYFNNGNPDTMPVVDDFSKDFKSLDDSYYGSQSNGSSNGYGKSNGHGNYNDYGKEQNGGFGYAKQSGRGSYGFDGSYGNDADVGSYGDMNNDGANSAKPKIVIANNDLFDENAPPIADKTAARKSFGRKTVEPKIEQPTADIYRKTTQQSNLKTGVYANSAKNSGYNAPPISLLKTYPINHEASKSEIEKKRSALERVLINNNYRAKIVGVVEGPSVLRFELRVDDTEDIKRIHSLQARMSYDLACNVNILAPIPNRDLIGVELANPNKRIIGFKEMIDTTDFMNSRKLVFALGKSVENKNYYADISEMPHCIVAGTTGSGKSVCLNNLLCSLLFKFSPKELKIILVDPKFVEFNAYYNLPHMLLKEPICQIDKAVNALNWAINEMNERYKKFAEIRVRKITEFNEKNPDEFMPYIVIMIDEFGDIMMSKKSSVDDLVVRLAQKARAAGIHLIIATQTPKKEIITGNIKSNCPTRIAFRVTDDIYSRVIIGENGAETLLGNGDMLYKSSRGELERLQAPYISNEEIELITDYIRDNNTNYQIDESVENIIYQKQAIIEGFDDVGADNMTFIKKAIEIFLENPNSVSTNVLQRRLGMGHPKASSIIDILERKGIVSQLENNRRKLLISKDDADGMFGNGDFDD